MDQEQLLAKLTALIDKWENETVEFKEATDRFSTDTIGKYVSALSNEANMRGLDEAWLVFGVRDDDRQVVGTDYRMADDHLQSLKQQIAQDMGIGLHFKELHVLQHELGRVVMMEIPAGPRGIPIAWKGHFYGRAGESLVPLSLEQLDEIRIQTSAADWSAQPVAGSTIDDLDEEAVEAARHSFALKHVNSNIKDEVEAWSDEQFLDKARITLDGRITRTALLLLGKYEASAKLSPHPAQLTWNLEGEEKAYEHFGPPFFMSSSKLYERIRNIQIRILPSDKLVAVEIAKYERRIVMEALHNCIAHQDYTRNGRIVVTEFPDRLVFENDGSFYEGMPGDYYEGIRRPRHYRNPFLTQAMTELNMIDTMGYGIHSIYVGQARRFLPMPDYDLREEGTVNLTIHGRVLDEAYTRLLMQRTDLPLGIVLALDQVQKGLPLSDDHLIKRLRREKLIEGRKPNLRITGPVAGETVAENDALYTKLVTDHLKKAGKATREELDVLVYSKMGKKLDEKEKKRRVTNILNNLRRGKVIENKGTNRNPVWVLAE